MAGLSPETWPILAAFLALQTLITVPLIVYVRNVHADQLTALGKSCDERIADLKAQQAALIVIYQATAEYAQRRGDTLHQEKLELQKLLDQNSQQMFRAVDALAELREAIKDLTRARRDGSQ